MAQYLIPYEIVGHILIEAANPQAACAQAIGAVRASALLLEQPGENEYRCPNGRVIKCETKRRHPTGDPT